MSQELKYFISPRHTADQFRDGWTLDDKLEVFIARVEGWQLGVARRMIEKDIEGRELALLLILTSYFEMIGKYVEGYIGNDQSRHFFKRGLREVFHDIEPTEAELMNSLYENLRCGLYHAGRPGSNVILNDAAPGAIGYQQKHDLIMISPTTMLEDIEIHFRSLAEALRNATNSSLRSNVEKRFDHDNALAIQYRGE